MDEWALVIARTVPLVVWTVLLRFAPTAIGEVEPRRDQRFRRILAVWLVEGACLAIFVGGLATAGVVSGDFAKLVYTAFGAVVVIVAAALLWTYRSGRGGGL